MYQIQQRSKHKLESISTHQSNKNNSFLLKEHLSNLFNACNQSVLQFRQDSHISLPFEIVNSMCKSAPQGLLDYLMQPRMIKPKENEQAYEIQNNLTDNTYKQQETILTLSHSLFHTQISIKCHKFFKINFTGIMKNAILSDSLNPYRVSFCHSPWCRMKDLGNLSPGFRSHGEGQILEHHGGD